MVKHTDVGSNNSPHRGRLGIGANQQPDQDGRHTCDLIEGNSARVEVVIYEEMKAANLSREDIIRRITQFVHEECSTTRRVDMRLTPYIWSVFFKDEARRLYAGGKYEDAIEKYVQAMRAYIGDVPLPSPKYLSSYYLSIDKENFRASIDLVTCASNIAQCYFKLGRFIETIDWTVEVEAIYTALRYIQKLNAPSWHLDNSRFIEHHVIRIKSRFRAYDLFSSLGNSSLATDYCNKAMVDAALAETRTYRDRIDKVCRGADYSDAAKHRHPDPKKLYDLEVTHPELQVRGVWKKVEIEGPKPDPRSIDSAWIWRGKLYIVGGWAHLRVLHDVWCLDLSAMKWRRLPDTMPCIKPKPAYYSVCPMAQWGNKAYLFSGTQRVWQFDMENETWSSLNTKFAKAPWPYSNNEVAQFASATLDGKLYIFGGDDGVTKLGCNIFMALDLKTLRWEHISGTSENIPCPDKPNLRNFPSLIAIPQQHKLYLFGGDANRAAARKSKLPHGALEDYTYDDIWSFDSVTKTWCRERWRGNHPCARTEMAAAFNPALNRAIVFGGFNGGMASAGWPRTPSEPSGGHHYSIYGDGFTFDPETMLWKHIIAKGFPSYRALAALVSDPDTGNTYLYGGYFEPKYLPKSRKDSSFSDIWQLKLDMPGGGITDEERNMDSRSMKMGPWKRCYTCGDAGLDYKKCTGTCGGQYFFCSVECQRAGWDEHKKVQHCRRT